MRLKKSSSYSPSLTALSATSASIGLSEGGNLVLTSHDSVRLMSDCRLVMVAASQTLCNGDLEFFDGSLEFRVKFALKGTVGARRGQGDEEAYQVDHFSLLAVVFEDSVVLPLLPGLFVTKQTDGMFLGAVLLLARPRLGCLVLPRLWFLGGAPIGVVSGVDQGVEKGDGHVLQKGDLATGHVEALLFRLRKVSSVVNVQLGVVDEGVCDVVVFGSRMFLL